MSTPNVEPARDLSKACSESAPFASHAELALLAQAMPQMVWIARPDGWNVWNNQQWTDYTGLTLAQTCGHGWTDAFHPDDRLRVWDAWREKRDLAAVFSLEARLRRADGIYRWWLIRALPLRDGAAPILEWVGTCTDIDDLKVAELEISRSKERFETVFHSGLVGFGISEIGSGRIIEVNDRLATFFGYAREEMIGRTVHELGMWADPADRACLVAGLAAGGGQSHGEADFRRKSGEIRQALVSLETFTLAGEAAPLDLLVLVDMTERKRIDGALRESERRFSSMMANLNLVSIMVDLDGRITHCNEYLLELTGWQRHEVLGRSWFEQFLPPGDSRARSVFTSLLADQPESWHHENEIVTRSGARRRIRWNNSVLRSASGEVVGAASIGEDVTEHRRTEEQLRQSQKMGAVGRLAGGVAHDFNNSLGVILGYTEILMRQAGEGQRGKLEQILKATRRATDLTRQLLAFSRKQVVDPTVLDLNALVSDLEKMLGRLIGEDVDLAIVAAADLGQVKADRGQLEQVVMNLCVNARDAMPGGGILRIETANVELDANSIAPDEPLHAGRYVMLAISDTGTGIAKEILAQVFEPFFTTKEEGKGTGLGLSMVYGTVKQAGGLVWVYSEVGMGTTFKVYLPRIDDAVAPKAEEAPMAARGSETILLVEDEGALREIAREILEEHGYTVIEAASALEAMETARRHPDLRLLVTDVVMPGMNGKALAEALLAGRPDLRVLYMSGYTDDVVAHSGVLESGTLLLEKPFTARALLGRVRAALGDPFGHGEGNQRCS